ncbi:MAG TPA: diacylglycerol kinase family protein, partial [Acidimicrobiia bacterium]|nr:diacylglycerol kinase family protein [Acidimicrobiia bacterium]
MTSPTHERSRDPSHGDSTPRPRILQRIAAVVVIVLLGVVLVTSVLSVVDDARLLVLSVPLLLVTLFAAWYALTRTGGRRLIGTTVCVAAVLGVLGLAIFGLSNGRLGVLAGLFGVLLAVALARYALGRGTRELKQRRTPGVAVAAAAHGVLIMNLKSGGGKAERFHLADECRKRGIEPVILRQGDDLLQLANDAVDRGADVVGMAGGDGSQALVATVAANRSVPMVVVPAGTRNHLALDLGLDRNDVVGALDAFGDAFERPIDLADVNGRVFVNNVSLGIYATIVRSPEYRDAKVDTTLAAVPKILGPGARPFDLRFAKPDGDRREGAHVLQISNNPYGNKSLNARTSRPRLDTKRLGVVSLEIADDRAASAFLTAFAAGQPERFAGYESWTA